MNKSFERDAAWKCPNEAALIEWIRTQVGAHPSVPVGIGDDCAAFHMPDGQLGLITTDQLIAGVHFRPEEITPWQVGHKAVARGLSDIAAMAGEALFIVVAVAAPENISVAYLRELFMGMKDIADRLDARIIGGDVASGELPLTITVTAIGSGKAGSLALRSAARPGDMLLVTGYLGGSILRRHLTFTPRLMEARWLRDAVPLHAMIDISDGLATDAAHVACESRVAIEIWPNMVPVSQDAIQLAASSNKSALEHALHDGEDYELLFTVSARDAERLLQRKDSPVKITCIGEVTAGEGLWTRNRNEERRPLQPQGWEHRLGQP